MGPNPVTVVRIGKGRFGLRHTGRRPCEDGGRDWSDAATSQSMSRIMDRHQKLGESQGTDSPSQPPEGNNPDFTLLASRSGRG